MSGPTPNQRIDAMMEAQRRTLRLLQQVVRVAGADIGMSLEQFFDDQYAAELGILMDSTSSEEPRQCRL